ncbi:MarR family winged helix-turn-helix transcriptional regulator [Rugamonas sp.]|uniref:MarR family winged helix-turn-helix transcriptional regulator n=1 Tax=Rugamonas sp. TaxID=1926287 RepID=UPI0025FCC86A|nr:MarR family winged helix-turn-helix transcriptional regulator [Rugamonas sp.]
MKHYTEKNYDPTTSVGFSITRARNIVISEMDAALRELDITSQQMGIVLSLSRQLISTPFELSKLLDIDTGLMTRMLDKLELQGLLTRVRSVDDRRSVNLQLTAKGHQTADAIPAHAPAVLNRRLQHFSAAEFQEFRRLLAKFLEG